MKYYVYVSDTKVDMIYSQIPQNILKKISAEFNINLGLISIALKKKEDVAAQETARYQKAQIVTDYLKKNKPVGSIENPSEYFEGKMNMSWGQFMKTPMVFFAGKTDKTWLALAGSSRHVVGDYVKGAYPSQSYSGVIIENLKEGMESGKIPEDENVGLNAYLRLVVRLCVGDYGRHDSLEFLARKLDYGKLPVQERSYTYSKYRYLFDPKMPYKDGDNILLGTPIYVSYH